MKNLYLILAVTTLLLSLNAEPIDAKSDSLVGKWESISGEMNGVKFDKTTKTFIEFDKEKMTLNGGAAVDYSVDHNKTSATIDIIANPKQVGIFKFENGELHLCIGKEGHRPTQFKSDNSDDCVFLVMRKIEVDQK